MNQKLIATIASTVLVLSPLPAFTADSSGAALKPAQASGPLAPGKAAGVRQAQGTLTVDTPTIMWVGGLLIAVGVGIYAVTRNADDSIATLTPVPAPTTTTTTTGP